ncbi:MAG: dephospho-CoA kinase [Candidatus Nitrotoga sp.]|nr:dephospho-CoA kinase [Candidatus Nitrotoga sp.]MBP0117842.1 dephospho-CoA kinase [Candidatus Nitrotoga sp.]MBP0123132.1 dephospho-CoA kinase [Candidatus Nitrotoga sp.]MBP0126132.1 dephospho-CoA kinase [Candidatus Nitrotoga sp.]
MRHVGLTGGIGSGKDTVAALFKELGVTVIDSDVISHHITQPAGAAIDTIRKKFGEMYITADGALDRALMRQLVFSDSAARRRLEAVLHPLIHAQLLAHAEINNVSGAQHSYLILVIPLLFESSNYRQLVQRTLVVDCTEEAQIARTMQRSHLDEKIVRAIMASQVTRTERLRHADNVIQNNGDLNTLRQQVDQLHQHYRTAFL